MGMMEWEGTQAVFGGIKLCRRKVTHKKIFVFLVVIGAMFYLAIDFLMPTSQSIIRNPANNPDWKLENEAALYFMKSLDQNMEPCKDFYAFACAKLRNRYAKENQDIFDTIDMLKKNARVALDGLLTRPSDASDSAILRDLKIFQQMCVNKTKIEIEGVAPVLTMLDQIGGWPLLTHGSETNRTWEEIVGSINRAGFSTFFPFHLELGADLRDSSATIIVLTTLLDPKRPRVLPNVQRTTNYVKVVASLLNGTNGRIDDDIRNCIDFETELEKITNSLVMDGDVHTLESLKTYHPEIAWTTFFRNAFVSTGIEVSSNETVLLSHSKYNSKVSELLNKTTARTIKNYIVWQIIEKAIPLMPEKFREAKNAFERRTVGQSRHFDCVDALIDKAKVSMGYLYVRHFFDGLAKNQSQAMIKSIESQAYRFLENITWMDNETNTRIIETLKNSRMMVPHLNDTIDVMETLNFRSNDTIFANYRRLAESHRILKYSRLRMSQEINQQLHPFESATIADAWYLESINTSYLLAAIFQRPFFSTSQPMYLNYGGIGFAMAHELTHALNILSVCDNESCPSYNRFQKRKECVEKAYGLYVLKQLNVTVNGKKTVEENIGDLIGLKLAYRAYEEFARESEEQLLPGLKYTARQLFWISAATTFCSYETDAALKFVVANEEHAPAEARVNIAFAHTEEFSRDFGCSISSRMNAARKCSFERAERPASIFDFIRLREL